MAEFAALRDCVLRVKKAPRDAHCSFTTTARAPARNPTPKRHRSENDSMIRTKVDLTGATVGVACSTWQNQNEFQTMFAFGDAVQSQSRIAERAFVM
jgi:hypothetical protein